MGVQTQESIDKRRARRSTVAYTVSAVTLVGAMVGLAFMPQWAPIPQSTDGVVSGLTTVSLGAPSSTLACPVPVTVSGSAATTLDDSLNEVQVGVSSAARVAAVGGQGTVDVSGLVPFVGNNAADGAAGTDPDDGADGSADASAGSAPAADPVSSVTGHSIPAGAVREYPGLRDALSLVTQGRAIAAPNAAEWTGAGVITRINGGDLRGSAGASCMPASSEQWLVGGSTELGSSAKLVVQNPSLTPATVTVTLWGPSGRVGLAGSESLLVAPGEQTELLLEGVAAEQRRLAVHVAAEGALVSSYMLHTELDGITAKGLDYVMPGATPRRVNVMPGVALGPTTDDTERASSVRLVAPDFGPVTSLAEVSEDDAAEVSGDVVGQARVHILGANGEIALFGADTIDLVAGHVVDVPLTGVPEGMYTIVVEADTAITAATRVNREAQLDTESRFGVPADFMWVPSLDSLTSVGESTAEGFTETTSGADTADPTATLDQNSENAPTGLPVTTPQGVLPLPMGMASTVAVTRLPNASTVDELTQAISDIPRVYAQDDAGEETDEETAARDAWRSAAAVIGRVVFFDAQGRQLQAQDVTASAGQTVTIDANTVDGAVAVAFVESPAPSAGEGSGEGESTGEGNRSQQSVVWSLVARSPDINGAMSSFHVPVVRGDSPEVVVERSVRAGLPTD